MEENKFDHLSKKIFENLEFEKLPKDFTEKLMLKIEQAKSATVVQPGPIVKHKFMFIFILTFSLITLISYFSDGHQENTTMDRLIEQVEIPTFDLSILSKYFDIQLEIGLIAKLIIGSIIVLILIDLASGSVIDRIIDSRTRKEN